MTKKSKNLYICYRCNNEVLASEQDLIFCNKCGHEIDTGFSNNRNQTAKENMKEKKKKNNNVFYLSIFFFAFFALIRYAINYESQDSIDQRAKMAELIFQPYNSSDYSVNTNFELINKKTKIPIFRKVDELSSLSYKKGNDKNIYASLISYHSENNKYYSLFSSRDSIITNYFNSITKNVEILDEGVSSTKRNCRTLKTYGYLEKKDEKINFCILSDYNSNRNKTWHLILLYKDTNENVLEIEKIISSREFIN
ncbi:MAG TPA: hypothetical protein VJY41_15475 [Prolixibacteraceae bacterium]|nr:hypothetical protein [Prolixibacteraceae bacterium]